MHLRKIPYGLITADRAAVAACKESPNSLSRSQRFNTLGHTYADIVPIVPETETFKHAYPPWTPFGYVLWQPLIAKSQGLINHHVFTIPSFLYQDLMTCHAAWLSTNKVPKALLDEVIEAWISTKTGKQLAPLLDGSQKWFIRLDQMSPKDSPLGGTLPSSTFEHVLAKICSSMRAHGCLEHEKADAAKQGRDMVLHLVLNPWDENMSPDREFRVFVPPPAARGANGTADEFKISAISQYRWLDEFKAPWTFTLQHVVDSVQHGADNVLLDIVAYAKESLHADMMALLLEYGFSFDVALQSDGSVQLVELNPFGAMSGCGACLFNWVLDGKVLYGLEEAQFLITMM